MGCGASTHSNPAVAPVDDKYEKLTAALSNFRESLSDAASKTSDPISKSQLRTLLHEMGESPDEFLAHFETKALMTQGRLATVLIKAEKEAESQLDDEMDQWFKLVVNREWQASEEARQGLEETKDDDSSDGGGGEKEGQEEASHRDDLFETKKFETQKSRRRSLGIAQGSGLLPAGSGKLAHAVEVREDAGRTAVLVTALDRPMLENDIKSLLAAQGFEVEEMVMLSGGNGAISKHCYYIVQKDRKPIADKQKLLSIEARLCADLTMLSSPTSQHHTQNISMSDRQTPLLQPLVSHSAPANPDRPNWSTQTTTASTTSVDHEERERASSQESQPWSPGRIPDMVSSLDHGGDFRPPPPPSVAPAIALRRDLVGSELGSWDALVSDKIQSLTLDELLKRAKEACSSAPRIDPFNDGDDAGPSDDNLDQEEDHAVPQIPGYAVDSSASIGAVQILTGTTPRPWDWGYNALSVAAASEGHALYLTMQISLEQLHIVAALALDSDALSRFLYEAEVAYCFDAQVSSGAASCSPKNPYHHSGHAADVTAAASHMLACEEVSSRLQAADALAVLFAAAMHDFRHPGLANNYIINTRAAAHTSLWSELATTYNDTSVLENMHAAQAFRLLNKPGRNFMACCSARHNRRFRHMVINCILATDLARSKEFISKFETELEAAAVKLAQDPQSAELFGFVDDAGRLNLAQMIVKASDVSHAARSWEQHIEWTERIQLEFAAQVSHAISKISLFSCLFTLTHEHCAIFPRSG